MARSDYAGFEKAAAISLNYALDSVETEIEKELASGADVTPDTLHRLLAVIKRQRMTERHAPPEALQ